MATLPGHPHARGHAARPAAATGANPADPTPTPPTVLLAGRLARNAAAARQAAHNAMVARNSHAGQ